MLKCEYEREVVKELRELTYAELKTDLLKQTEVLLHEQLFSKMHVSVASSEYNPIKTTLSYPQDTTTLN